eukprot:GDKJ01038765.1.p1 GENE.GDKJ01038765.1~~GDKJ01038765.1.p1  ORF type:complete len:200 (+),score=42.78 GDKJ01038765.1:162-761(+)
MRNPIAPNDSDQVQDEVNVQDQADRHHSCSNMHRTKRRRNAKPLSYRKNSRSHKKNEGAKGVICELEKSQNRRSHYKSSNSAEDLDVEGCAEVRNQNILGSNPISEIYEVEKNPRIVPENLPQTQDFDTQIMDSADSNDIQKEVSLSDDLVGDAGISFNPKEMQSGKLSNDQSVDDLKISARAWGSLSGVEVDNTDNTD